MSFPTKEMNKEEVIKLLETNDLVLAYDKVGGVDTEIRLLMQEGKLVGVIFSPDVKVFDLSNFNGSFNIRTDILKQSTWFEKHEDERVKFAND